MSLLASVFVPGTVIVDSWKRGDDVEAPLEVVGFDDSPEVFLGECVPAVGGVEQAAERLLDEAAGEQRGRVVEDVVGHAAELLADGVVEDGGERPW